MPEGPEVQVVLNTLEANIQGRVIQDVQVFYDKVIENVSAKEFCSLCKNEQFRKFYRIGKYLGFELSTKDLIVHLRMEGKFYLYKRKPIDMKHIHVMFILDDGTYMCYHDTRKFGRMNIFDRIKDKHKLPVFKNVGYDFMDERATWKYFYDSIHHSKRQLKQALLDQSIIAGVGNIYADEICFASRLDPRSRCTRISKKDCEKLVFYTKKILNDSIALGGTTIRSYTSSLGVTGLFQHDLGVHDKKGEPCPICGNTIKKFVVGQRGTYICQNCQKRK